MGPGCWQTDWKADSSAADNQLGSFSPNQARRSWLFGPLPLAIGFTPGEAKLSGCLLQGSFFFQLAGRDQLTNSPGETLGCRRLGTSIFFPFCDKKRDLPFDLLTLRQLRKDLVSGAAQELFVQLGH